MENKSSWFLLDLDIDQSKRNTNSIESLNDSIDLILDAMKAGNEDYKFFKKDKSRLIHFFKTEQRKRKGQLTKFCDRFLPENGISYQAKALRRLDVEEALVKIKKSDEYNVEEHNFPVLSPYEYKGSDLKIFDDKKNWHPWQSTIYDILFDKDGNITKPHEREIINLVDLKGNSGKSSFFKWLYINHQADIGRISYGSASQLRSAITNIGQKKIYIIDLARSKSKQDKEEDLLSVIEDTKSGLVTNPMYGHGKTLVMPPPHIIISCNYTFKYELLSMDRWKVYEILEKSKSLGKLNRLISTTRRGKVLKK